MLFVSLAASLFLAGADQAQAAPVEAAAPAPAVAEAPKPKTRKVCYDDPATLGTRLAKRICKTEVVPEQKAEAKAPKSE
jgi:hypothetical protein